MKIHMRHNGKKCSEHAQANWRGQYEFSLSGTQRACFALEFGNPKDVTCSPAGKLVWAQNKYGHMVLAWQKADDDTDEFDHV